jgi:hypothetical protein
LPEIRQELLNTLILISSHHESHSHVLRKILSTLSSLFSKFPNNWQQCIHSTVAAIVASKAEQQPTHEAGNIDFSPSFHSVCQSLSEKQIILGLEFCIILIEDVKKNAALLNHHQETMLDSALDQNVPDLVVLLRYAVEVMYPSLAPPINDTILSSVFKTYSAWALNHTLSHEYIELLHPVTEFIFTYIQLHPDTPLCHAALDLISEIMTRYPSFYDHSGQLHLSRILREIGQPIVVAIEEKNKKIQLSQPKAFIYDDDEEIIQLHDRAEHFAKAAMAVCELSMADIDDLNLQEASVLLHQLLVITDFPGPPYVNNDLVVCLLEFWNIYTDAFLDSDDSIELSTEPNPYILKVIEILWNKAAFPSEQQRQQMTWDEDDWEAFTAFRDDFSEFLNSAVSLVGPSLLSTLVSHVLETLATATSRGSTESVEWAKLEASLFCITALSDTFIDNSTADINEQQQLLVQLFQSTLLDVLSHAQHIEVRKTGVSFVGAFAYFYGTELGRPFLATVLDCLFHSLSDSLLSTEASESLLTVSSLLRTQLVEFLPSFFNMYTKLYEQLEKDSRAHERTVLAISFVIQAVESIDQKSEYVNQLTSIIFQQLEQVSVEFHHDSSKKDKSSDNSNDDILFSRTLSLLTCLGNLGSGLQQTDSNWNENKFHFTSHLLEVVKIFTLEQPYFRTSPEICERCCSIIKSGLNNTTADGGQRLAGPFKFSDQIGLEFIKAKHETGPVICYPYLVDLGCHIISTTDGGIGPADIAQGLLGVFFGDSTIEKLLDYGPDEQAALLKLLCVGLDVAPNQVVACAGSLHQQHQAQTKVQFELYTDFALAMLKTHDVTILRTATLYWTKLLGSLNKPASEKFPAETGLALVTVLMELVSDTTVRAYNLEYYLDILKALLFHPILRPVAIEWLHKVLLAPGFGDATDGSKTSKEAGTNADKMSSKKEAYFQHLTTSDISSLSIKDIWY